MHIPNLYTRVATWVCCGSLAAAYTDTSAAYGTFETPGALVRPGFRYWLPDAGVDPTIVQQNIAAAGSIGAGGVEFVPFYDYGGELEYAAPGPDWVTYGFGTVAFRDMFIAALNAHKDNGLMMDFALGPSQGQGVPARVDDPGLQWDLAPFSVTVPANGSFQGVIPGWGTGELVSLVAAEVLSIQNMTGESGNAYQQLIIRNGTLKDYADIVSTATGEADIQLSSNATHWLFAFYQYQTLNQNLIVDVQPSTSIFDNGSFVVDHYSSRGAETVIKFWETHILTPEVKQLLRDVGHYAWEDSIEITCNISWTPTLPTSFSNLYGYDLKSILPLVMFGNNNLEEQSSSPGSTQCLLDTPDQGQGYVNDYRNSLTLGYRQYLETLTNWTKSELDLHTSTQVSYNLPMDMEANIPFVSAPECESLQFGSNIDGYSQFVGPAQLAGKRVISNEMGAIELDAFRLAIPTLLWMIHRALSAGVNRFVLHGQDYTGNYYETTWPGYVSFDYLFSGQYSDKDPAWYHGFADALNYVARVQYTQQTSHMLTDVAIYNKVSATDPNFPTIYNFTVLIDQGYTYNYLSPANFELPQATVSNGVLGFAGPAYKALIIAPSSNVSSDGIQTVQEYARQGLPVIVAGEPGYFTSANDSSSDIQAALKDLQSSPNVYTTSPDDIAQQLISLGLTPNVPVNSNGTWYTTWREDEDNDIFYNFIFNDSENFTVGFIEVPTVKTPYVMDAWTGQTKPLLLYQTIDNNRTRIPLRLEANQTALFSFSDKVAGEAVPGFHATQLPSAVLGYQWDSSCDCFSVHVSSATWDQSINLSDGRTLGSDSVQAPAVESFTVSNWTLVVEHWEAPSNLSDASIVAVKHNSTYELPAELASWLDIDGLTNASGVGYYTTNFKWPPTSGEKCPDGAYIRLPEITHAVRLYVNGQQLSPVDPSFPQIDISSALHCGRENTVMMEVPSMMWNYIRSIIGDLTFMGTAADLLLEYLGGLPDPVDNGVIGDVLIVPFNILSV